MIFLYQGFEEASYAYQGCFYLIKNMVKTSLK